MKHVMDAATAEHVTLLESQIERLEGRLARLRDERDRIVAEFEDPLAAQAERARVEWDARIAEHRRKYCRCHACDKQFDTERGLKQHHRRCRWFQQWKEAHIKWTQGGRVGPAPRLAFP